MKGTTRDFGNLDLNLLTAIDARRRRANGRAEQRPAPLAVSHAFETSPRGLNNAHPPFRRWEQTPGK